MNEFWDDFSKSMNRVEDHLELLRQEYLKLLSEPCLDVPEIGDHVLVHAGLLNRGHAWIRLECEVLAIGDSSYRLKFLNYKQFGTDEPLIEWINSVLVTEVIKS